MNISYSHRLAVLVALELTLAAAILCIAFLVAVSSLRGLAVQAGEALVAQGVFAASLLVPFWLLGVHRVDRHESISVFIVKFSTSTALGVLICYAAFTHLSPISTYLDDIPRAAGLSILGLLVFRFVLAPRLRLSPLQHRVLIVGTGMDAALVDQALRASCARTVSVVGFYPTAGTQVEVAKHRILPATGSLTSAAEQFNVHGIVVAVREQRGGALPVKELLDCRLKGVEVTDVPAVLEKITGRVPVEVLKSSWLIYSAGFRKGRFRRAVKRTFDIVMASTLLVLGAPFVLLAGLAILLDSGRPLLYRQERVGLDGKPFWLNKFRSMRVDAEKDGVPRWASNADPRITRIGAFLRRTRIDELPQLINVLRGEMSFVGPRPERPYFVAQLTEKVPFYCARHSVKPGVTGWAQVRYSYGASVEDAVRKLEFDMYYVKNQSLMLDVVILFKTVRVVLWGDGAR